MQKYKKAALNIAFLTLLLSGGLSIGTVNASADNYENESINQEEKILETFENNDYDNWKKIVAKKAHLVTMVSKEDFENFILARKAARTGNYDLAIKTSKDLESELKLKFSGKLLEN